MAELLAAALGRVTGQWNNLREVLVRNDHRQRNFGG